MRRPTFLYPPPGPIPVQAWILIAVLATVVVAAVWR